MSESDDSDLLADIEALDDALKTKSQPYVGSSQRSDTSDRPTSDVDECENDDCSEYLSANREIDDSLNAYEINARLIMGLTIVRRKLTALLKQCEQKIELVDEKMGKSRDGSGSSSKLAISNAGMPYFKDKDYFSAPQNGDTKTKERRGELYGWSLTRPSRWTGRDRETLLSAINNQCIESVLCGGFSKEIEASTSDDRARTTKLVLPRNFNEMVGELGERDFDWFKISAMDFDGKHSPGECRAMWNVYLHPQFRKSEWTSAEDKKLLRCAREYRYQNWDAIMRKLGTNRSAYQCFIRYNTIKKMPATGRAWTRQEDKHLVRLMNVIKIGDYIPWSDIANHMRHRTKQQIYVRWMYRKAPHLRKGRFNTMETSDLLKAVQKYGLNFCKISRVVMPNRTSTQLQERYHTVMAKFNNWNVWSATDDMLLISLHLKHRNNWSKIATYFCDKSRTQVRHRYNAVQRYAMRGVSIDNMPRQSTLLGKRMNKKTLSKKALRMRNKITSEMHKMQRVVSILDIQLRLYETLCLPPSIRPNNSEEEPYGIQQLACDTKRLCNTLNRLNANLDIPDDFVNYVQLSDREKQLLVSLKEHVNVRNVSTQDNELVEKFRMRMFGYAEVSESDFFIPPFPFDGYVKIKKVRSRRNSSIDYDLDVSEEFLVEMPANFSITSCVLPFVSVEEEIQFHKLGQFLIRDYQNYGRQNVGLYRSLRCILSFADSSTLDQTSSEYDQSGVNSRTPLEDYEQTEVNRLGETLGGKDDEEVNLGNIILPNQATLLGLKNLLLWKLLYDCQHESHVQCELMASFGGEPKSEQTATNSRSTRTGSPEYQLLRARLLQLFKLPIGLSNTILQIHGPEAIFSVSQKKKQSPSKIIVITRKRKFKEESDGNPLQLNETNDSAVSGNSDSQLDADVATENPLSRLRKRYKTTRN